MVVLILLGILAKLAIAATIAHRTRLWWLPGAAAIAVGAGSLVVLPGHVMHAAAAGSIGLGAGALAIGRLLRRAR